MQLKDTGNRTDLGSGGLRDINSENGRCDLLPAYVMAKMTEKIVADPANNKSPILSGVLFNLFRYMETKCEQFLFDCLPCMSVYHWDKNSNTELETDSDVIAANTILDLSVHYKRGAEKYAERNWEKGIPTHSFIDSAIRHLCKELLGWTDEPHDIACLWNICGLIWTLKYRPDLDDMPNYSDTERRPTGEVKEKDTEAENKVEKDSENNIYSGN